MFRGARIHLTASERPLMYGRVRVALGVWSPLSFLLFRHEYLCTKLEMTTQTKERQKKFDNLLARQTPVLDQGDRCVVNLSSKQLEDSHISVLSLEICFPKSFVYITP